MVTQDNNLAFTEAGKILSEFFNGRCERYITYKERMVQ